MFFRKIDAFKKQLQDDQDFIYVADSALYTIKKLLAAKNLRWITRVPESIKAARELVEKDFEEFTWKSLGDKYNYCELKSEHGGVEQRWQVIYSTEAFKKEEKSLTKRIEKEISFTTYSKIKLFPEINIVKNTNEFTTNLLILNVTIIAKLLNYQGL